MMNFKNSKTAKAISGIVGLATAAMMMGPSVVSAATVEELTAQINALLAQVSALQAAQTTTTATTGHTFSVDLTIGSKGADVVALQEILVAKGFLVMPEGVAMGYFGSLTKAAVSKWQASAGISPTAGYVGPKSRAALNAMSSTTTTTTPTTPTTTATGVSAMLDTTSPAASAVFPGASVDVAAFKISNMSSAAVKITSLKMARTGIATDATLRNVYLYNGAARITDAATVSTGVVNFTDTAGIVTIPAMTSVVLKARVEVDPTAVASHSIGLTLTEVTSDAGAVTGLPIAGAIHSVVVAPSDIATASFNVATAVTPQVGNTQVDPQADFVMWQNNVQIGSRDVLLSSIRFRQTGSVSQGDLKNFRLYVWGTMVGSAVEKVGNDGYVTFDFASPIVLKSGSREIKLLGDVVSGSNKTFAFSLQQAVDSTFWDSQMMVVIPTKVNNLSFVSLSAPNTVSVPNVNTVKEGALTIVRSTDSPSGNIINQGSNVTLAKFDFKATGERLKVENLVIGFTSSDAAVGGLRNGAVYVNGVQIGSVATIASTTYNFGSSLILEPGVTSVVEVRADIFDNAGTNDLSSGDTIKVMIGAGSANVYKMSSYGYLSLPAAFVAGNSVTVTDGSVSLAKYSAYANQTVVVPKTAFKIGEFRLTSGSTEGVNISNFTLDFGSSTGNVSNLQDVYLVYGSKTSTVKSSVAAASNSYSVNEVLAVNSTMTVQVYATVNASLTAGQTIVPTLSVTGTSLTAGNAVAANLVVGQTMTVGTGTIASALDASTPVTALVVANSMPKVASFKFVSSNEAYTLTELTATVASLGDAAAIKNIVFKDGGTTIATQPMNGVSAAATGLNIAVANNATKVIDVYADLDGIGTGYASTSVNVGVTLDSFKYRDSNGVEATDGTDRVGNPMYAYKTKPTITNAALPTSVLSAGTMTIGKVTVTADAGGTVAWRKMVWNYTASGAFTVTSPTLVDESGTAIAGVTMSIGGGKITASSTAGAADQEVSGSKTYTLKATIGGVVATSDSLSTNIASSGLGFVASTDAANVGATATFVWSDESSSPHSELTQDWNNDNLVKNIPTDSQTLTK